MKSILSLGRRRVIIWATTLLIMIGNAGTSLAADRQENEEKAAARKLMMEYAAAWEKADEEAVQKLLHTDFLFVYPGGRLDRAAFLAMFRDYTREKKEIRFYHGLFFYSEGKFVAEYQFAATDVASKRRQAVGSAASAEMRDGKLALYKEYYDESVGELQRTGYLVLDEGKVSPWPYSVMLRPETVN